MRKRGVVHIKSYILVIELINIHLFQFMKIVFYL
jgi:hypothetical protein